ncbi:proline-rich protein 15 [Neopelma chrysocephalum]|uniref:proline-rich protein 15 n=1 Tax=Neopelma chrysocephalum TaxID=114329 RepID=UPI000FCD076A|nr:proline-rich protein 15 [Neopelma chrysocephalum]
MADSAAATAAPRAAVKGGSAAPWWKSLTSKKKHKEAAAASPPPAASETPADPPSPDGREEQPTPFGSGDAAGTGGGSRRSLRVSHSGRFKERRKVRTSLLGDGPEVFDGGGAPSHAAQGGE